MDNIIGERINTGLALRNMKQKELAHKLDVKDNVVSYWCKGSRIPNTEQIIKIADVLKVSTDYLLGVSEVATSDKDLQYICDYTGLSKETVQELNEICSLYKKAKSFELKEYTPQILTPNTINSALNWILSNSDQLHCLLVSCICADNYLKNFNINSVDVTDYVELCEYNNELNDLLIDIYAVNFMLQQSFIEYLKKEYNIDHIEKNIDKITSELSIYQKEVYMSLKKIEKQKVDENE